MNTNRLIVLLALLSLLPSISQAKSPWDKTPVATEDTPAESTASETDMVEPVAAQPISPDESIAAQPAPAEPVAATESIEIIETSGDVLAMPQLSTNQTDTTPVLLLDFPRRGMDQEKVQSELGTPIDIKPAVGDPPITRWIYNDRVVYFERSTVLHVVAR